MVLGDGGGVDEEERDTARTMGLTATIDASGNGGGRRLELLEATVSSG